MSGKAHEAVSNRVDAIIIAFYNILAEDMESKQDSESLNKENPIFEILSNREKAIFVMSSAYLLADEFYKSVETILEDNPPSFDNSNMWIGHHIPAPPVRTIRRRSHNGIDFNLSMRVPGNLYLVLF